MGWVEFMNDIKGKQSLKVSKTTEVTDWRKLLAEKDPDFLPEPGRAYGASYHLKKFAGINAPLSKCSIEHGFMTGRFVCQGEVGHHVSHILTFSPFREEVIKEVTDLTPIAIGPYIAYAKDYRPLEYVEKMKKRMGRTLLVMPSHSTGEVRADYNIGQFIQQIEAASKDFDTVMACIFFMDLRMGRWKPYKKKGYHIVSAGSPWSRYFLSRLRHIICLSDAVMVNDVTTGMAYAMHMNRPVRLIRQQVKVDTHRNFSDLELERKNHYEQVCDMFDQSEFVITKEQRKFGSYMFGLDSVKTKKEMRELLLPLTRTMAGGGIG